MDSIRICMIAVAGVTVITLIKKWNSDFLPLLRLAVAILLAGILFAWISPLVSYLKNLADVSGISHYAEILFKALGIALLTQFCGDLCRESGEIGAANGVEMAGKIEILLLSLPLLNEILELAKKLLTL